MRLGIGAEDAPVKVVEFFDYRCTPCKAMHLALEALVANHPEMRVEMRHLPILSPGSERAARFALTVEQLEGEETYARVNKALWHLRGPLSTASFQKIEGTVTYEQIAAMVGATRQWVTQSLDKLRSEGIVEIPRSEIVICDIEKLEE